MYIYSKHVCLSFVLFLHLRRQSLRAGIVFKYVYLRVVKIIDILPKLGQYFEYMEVDNRIYILFCVPDVDGKARIKWCIL